MSTRRMFLRLSSAAALASALPGRLFGQSDDVFTNQNLGAYLQASLTQAVFEKHVGEDFTLFYPDGSTVRLTLLAVKGYTPMAPKTRGTAPQRTTTAFTVSFSSAGRLVPQASYKLDHGVLGSFVAFLVPGDVVRGGTCSATFNYL